MNETNPWLYDSNSSYIYWKGYSYDAYNSNEKAKKVFAEIGIDELRGFNRDRIPEKEMREIDMKVRI